MAEKKILVDTCIWSLALRRNSPKESVIIDEFRRLIKYSHAEICGPVRQEILSGVKSPSQFATLQSYLAVFPDLPLTTKDYEQAAHYFNLCRTKGIQGSHTDFLLCSIATHRKLAIFTTDKDFEQFAKVLPIKLHSTNKMH